jgi:myo-inositol catabolism protein IolS
MQYRNLSGMRVSVVAFGAWQIGDTGYWGADDQSDAEATVHAALDAGVNLFDTAEMYGDGESERALGRCLGARRAEVLVASKVAPDHCVPGGVRASCEASLRRLGSDWIDLYQVHWPPDPTRYDDTRGELERLRDEGKIRAVGVSNFGPGQLDQWMQPGTACVSNQVGYNLAFRAAEHEVLTTSRKHGLGVLAYMPLMQGILAGKWASVDALPQSRRRTRHFSGQREGATHGEPGCEDLLFEMLARLRKAADETGHSMATLAVAWALAGPGVCSVILGARKPAQLTRNLAAADLDLSPELKALLDRISDPLKVCLGPNPDMWRAGEEKRIH